jgi:hypothetical protein
MVFDTQNYCSSGLSSLSGILETGKNTMFHTLDLFPSSGDGRKTHTLLGPLERVMMHVVQSLRLGLSKGSNRMSSSHHLRMETYNF